jgi:hypothetical protein
MMKYYTAISARSLGYNMTFSRRSLLVFSNLTIIVRVDKKKRKKKREKPYGTLIQKRKKERK